MRLRKIAILVFGVLPAVYLSLILAQTLIVIPGQFIRSGDPADLIIAAQCLAGVLGTVALIFAVFGRITRATVIGLLLGVAAILPVIVGDWGKMHSVFKFLLGAPLVVGVYLIFENRRALFESPRMIDE